MRLWLAGKPGEDTAAASVWAARLGLGLLVLGMACRLYVYCLGFPLWRDEASLALNFVHRDFRGLLGELDNFQVAPLLFLWLEKAIYQFLGGSAALLRLPSLLAGLTGFVLFWQLARRSLAPLPAAFAVGILAVAAAPLHLAAMVKPYSLDLFTATLLLSLAAGYLRSPTHTGRLAVLALVIPFVLAASYPAIFVAVAVGLVLLPVVWRHAGVRGRCWFLAYSVLGGATFLVHLHFVGHEGHDATLPRVEEYMASFWHDGFLPRRPAAVLPWLARCHTGHMLSYPLAFNGGGLLGLLLAVAGTRALYRQRQVGLLGLCLLPFALNFAASVLHRYPYAGDQRLEQHLVPGLCLLLGAGLADLLQRLPDARGLRTGAVASAIGLLLLIGLIQAVRDTLHPYYDVEAAWAKDVGRYLRREVGPHDLIVFPHSERFTLNSLRWHLLPLAGQVCCGGETDEPRFRASGRMWFLDQMVQEAPFATELPCRDPHRLLPEMTAEAWQAVERRRFLAREPNPKGPQAHHFCCDVYLLVRQTQTRAQLDDRRNSE